jgi:tetratricopeptide (TPR) repeat protein
MRTNRTDHGWNKQPYFAVTVPDDMGFKKHFALEGLVYKVYPDTVQETIDADVTRRALYDDFKYGGLFFQDGSWDSTVYKDENASTLSRNYAAAHLQLAFHYRRTGERERAVAEMERVARMFPDFTDIMVPLGSFYLDAGDTARALALFERLVNRSPRDAEARYYYGVLLSYSRKIPEALQQLEEVIKIDPGYQMAYFAAYYTLWDGGQQERALTYLERWLQIQPGDEQTRALMEQQRHQLGLGGPSQPMPRPPVPQLP